MSNPGEGQLRRHAWLAALAASATGCPQIAAAGGFNVDHQNAAAMGAAFAGSETAAADAGFAAYNPASIAGLDRPEISANISGVWPFTRYRDAEGALLGAFQIGGGASGEKVIDPAFAPNLSVGVPLSDRITIGLVANATFGFRTDYAPDSIIRYQAQESDLKVLEASPMAAFEISDGLRVGASLRIQYADLSLTSIIDAGGIAAASSISGFAPGGDDLPAAFEASDFGLGYSVGAQADLNERIHIGIAYLSGIKHNFDGRAAFDLAASPAAQTLNGAVGLFGADRFTSGFSTPATASAGIRYDASDRLAVLASARRMFWSSFDVITLTFNDGVTPPEILTQNWRDSWLLSLGAEYAATDQNMVRAGFMFDESPVNPRFASPRIPDGDRFWLAAGATRKFNESVSADLSLAYAFFSDRDISLGGAEPENLFRGGLNTTIETGVFAASFRMRWKF